MRCVYQRRYNLHLSHFSMMNCSVSVNFIDETFFTQNLEQRETFGNKITFDINFAFSEILSIFGLSKIVVKYRVFSSLIYWNIDYRAVLF